ncbi:MAG: arsenic efflux protein [Christensenellaceae bacterium]|nr:arsenic efflux protein [Christensenellaceae bacterium]
MWWEVLLEALIDSAKILPILLAAYILIELIETAVTAKKIKGKKWWTPIAGAGFGLIPQCGFSVVAADMYSKRQITLGALFAVFIATSDEAIPVILANPESIGALLPLLLIKFVFALSVGLLVDAALRLKKNKQTVGEFVHQPSAEPAAQNLDATLLKVTVKNARGRSRMRENPHEHHIGCCGHHVDCENGVGHSHSRWHRYLLHPLIHSLKIFGFILAINILFGFIIYFVGEAALTDFLMQSYWFTPLLAVAVGLIPNCASSVVITELYIVGGIPFGACLAGLCINAGLGFIILFKQNKNIKQNLAILGSLFVLSVAVGYLTLFFEQIIVI